MDDTVVEDREDRENLERVVASGLAELSIAEMTPTEVTVREQFAAEDVDFSGTGWLVQVGLVQDWLRLPRQLDTSDGPLVSLSGLLEDLGMRNVAEGYTASADQLMLSDAGLELLQGRVERALEFKDRFLERLDEDSLDAATAGWIESWEEAVEETVSGPIVARATTWAIQDFASRAQVGRLELSPTYQRGDVWPNKDAQLLIESILRGIPLPSVIILKPRGGSTVPFEVVDGKQRLTAILRFMGKHPLALKRVKEEAQDRGMPELKTLFDSDYPKFRRVWRNVTGENLSSTAERDYYFPFRLGGAGSGLVGDLEPLRGRYFHEIRDHRLNVGGEEVDVNDVFTLSVEYKIPVIEYSEATPRQIHEVFKIYNKQGKHLNAEEIRNAVYHDVDLMRALTVTAGDHNSFEPAPFLEPARDPVETIRTNLREYGVSDARYRRTKVLSWVYSLLFSDSTNDEGSPRLLSTAAQINALLDRVQSSSAEPFRQHGTIRDSVSLVATAMNAHAVADAWSGPFKDTKAGAKWQELQLVGSLLGVAMAAVVLGPDTEDRVIEKEDSLRDRTSTAEWRRPKKTQTATQWRYVARLALGILDQLGVPTLDVDTALRGRFGASCVPALTIIRQDTPPGPL